MSGMSATAATARPPTRFQRGASSTRSTKMATITPSAR